MTHLLSIPENVMIQHIFPSLDHNDILRLRRVSKQTKAFADAYLFTPQPGHQGKWELKIDSSEATQTLEAFIQKGLPPPSRLYIANEADKGPSEQKSFFKDEHLEEFMDRYSKYVTNLRLDKLFIPFTSAKEIGFYESLVNLTELRCKEMITVQAVGVAKFEEKTTRAEGRFLIRPTWSKKLKIFKLVKTTCMNSMWNFINGLSHNLEELMHPFELGLNFTSNFAPAQQLIEDHGTIMNQRKLVYDWRYLFSPNDLDLLRVFASCRDNGVIIKNLSARHLDCLLRDKNGRVGRVIQQNNLFVGSIIHSLMGVNDAVYLLDLPALEDVWIQIPDPRLQRPRDGYPEWPNLRKMKVRVNRVTPIYLRFLEGGLRLPKLEELTIEYYASWKNIDLPIPRNFGVSCGNVKKLSIFGWPGNNFFLRLWEELPLLEEVTLNNCWRLTNKGFVGNGGRGSRPAFLNLQKLKHLTIKNPRVTDAVFRNVFRNLKLTSFKLSSDRVIKSLSVGGIKELLSGPFAENIQRLDLAQLQLKDVSQEELKQVASCFRSSKML